MKEKYTPMMQQYLDIKENYQDAILFTRIGDFYEMFFDDARIASKELDLVLTGKNAGVKERVPMCGIPHHAASNYIQRLVQRGYKVAIVEQLTDPKESKGIVERDVIRVITPGTVVDEITDEKSSVYVSSIEDYGYGYSLCVCEVSTGENFIEDIPHQLTSLTQTILKNNIREVVIEKNFNEKVIQILRELHVVVSYCDERDIDEAYFPLIESLKKEYDLNAYGRMIHYLEETQKMAISHLQPCVVEKDNEVLYMDYSTQENLELVDRLHKESNGDTLWSFLDECKCCMGSRLLKKWVEKPLVKKEEILKRQGQVEFLMDHFMERETLRTSLSNVYDLQRLIARIAMNSANAIDLVRLSKTLKEVPTILDTVASDEFDAYMHVDPLKDLNTLLDGAFVENPPALISGGGMFAKGFNEELDKAREVQESGRQFISDMEVKEKERTGIKTLKIGYNKVFGYYIEISKAAAKEVKPEWGYVRKQTLVNNERFISSELKEKEDAILHAEEHAIALEKQLFNALVDHIKKDLPKLQQLALVLAQIDCLQALAEVSSIYGYIKPEFSEDELHIKDGRHPILDEMMKDPKYVANSIDMDHNNHIHLITGPNMGGKSTYMREIALIVILAQMGCFVPASECVMPLFDKIFTRIGASDDILSGQSTFMVEMNEANEALQKATPNSLILFDEIGRGTSTYDGMSLAQSMVEYIATHVHAKTLFSTHYHELTGLEESINVVQNVHVVVKEENDKVTFLYKVKKGTAGKSYGINVARLAGLPEVVLERAKEIQKDLESHKTVVQQSFTFVESEPATYEANPAIERLKSVKMDELSPKHAWMLLEELVEDVNK